MCGPYACSLCVWDILLAQLQSEVCTAPVRPAHSGPCFCLMVCLCPSKLKICGTWSSLNAHSCCVRNVKGEEKKKVCAFVCRCEPTLTSAGLRPPRATRWPSYLNLNLIFNTTGLVLCILGSELTGR